MALRCALSADSDSRRRRGDRRGVADLAGDGHRHGKNQDLHRADLSLAESAALSPRAVSGRSHGAGYAGQRDAFHDTRMESLQTFAEIFGIKEDRRASRPPHPSISRRCRRWCDILFAGEGSVSPSIDQYDCIVVDECHRGYLLDRGAIGSRAELSQRRGLHLEVSPRARLLRRREDRPDSDAGPATSEIFGAPVF